MGVYDRIIDRLIFGDEEIAKVSLKPTPFPEPPAVLPHITFDGYFKLGTESKNLRLPKKYIINDNAAILFWDDENKDKTVVRRTKNDTPDPRIAFLTAYFQKHSGLSRTKANRYLDGLVVEHKEQENKEVEKQEVESTSKLIRKAKRREG